jgi:hypothetical protein
MARGRANVIAAVDDARAKERFVTIYEPDPEVVSDVVEVRWRSPA